LGKPKISGLTDDAGYFYVKNIAPGEYTVQMEKVDFFILRGQPLQVAAAPPNSFTLNHIQEVREKVDVVGTPIASSPRKRRNPPRHFHRIFYIPVPEFPRLQAEPDRFAADRPRQPGAAAFAGRAGHAVANTYGRLRGGDPVSGALTIPIIVDGCAPRSEPADSAPNSRTPARHSQFETPERATTMALQCHGLHSGPQIRPGREAWKLLSADHIFGAAGRGKLGSAVVQRRSHLSIDGTSRRATTPASSGSGDTFRGCCGTWRRTTACISPCSTTIESDTSVGLDSLHPQSTTLDEPATACLRR